VHQIIFLHLCCPNKLRMEEALSQEQQQQQWTHSTDSADDILLLRYNHQEYQPINQKLHQPLHRGNQPRLPNVSIGEYLSHYDIPLDTMQYQAWLDTGLADRVH